MGFYKSKIGLVWSLILTVLIVFLPKYWELKIDSIPPLAPPSAEIPKTRVVEDTIQKNTTLVATLVDYDVPEKIAKEVADLIRPVFDVRKMRFGNAFGHIWNSTLLSSSRGRRKADEHCQHHKPNFDQVVHSCSPSKHSGSSVAFVGASALRIIDVHVDAPIPR